MRLKKIAISITALSLCLIMMLAAPVMADMVAPLFVDSLVVTPSTQTINAGETAAYEAWYYPAFGTPENVTSTCSWSIDDESIASPIASGQYLGNTSGTANVRAISKSLNLESNTAELNVKEPTQGSETILIIQPGFADVYVGDAVQYRAYLRYSNGDPDVDVTDECTWGIAISSIGHMTATKGEYFGDTPGNSEINAHYVREGSTLTVYQPPLDLVATATLNVLEMQTKFAITLEVTPPSATIMVGETQQYYATLHYSDGSPDQNVTDIATWSLSAAIADAIDPGRYKGTVSGTANVTAEYTPPGYFELSDDAILNVAGSKIPDNPPPTEKLPDGKIIDRQPGYITLCEPQYLGTPALEFTMSYEASRMDSNPDRHPKVFYWNTTYQKWVALTSYPLGPGNIKALNDGHYSGWFVVMGCIQPNFTDVHGNWAEKFANRMNGLGLLEGYPNPANPSSLTRPAGLERIIIRSELTATVARILGLSPGDTHLYPTITYMPAAQNDAILNSHYVDADEILPWARPYIAAMTQAGLVSGKGNRFAPNDELTRIEAAVIISNALRDVPGFGTPADLRSYSDYENIPSWAIGRVSQGTINGYPDGSLRPNKPISRAEAESLLITLLRGLGW